MNLLKNKVTQAFQRVEKVSFVYFYRFYLSVVEQYMCSELGLLNNSGQFSLAIIRSVATL